MRPVSRWAVAAAFFVAACGGGGGGGSGGAGGGVSPTPPPPPGRAPFTLPAPESLSVADVQRVIAQAVAEARARNLPSVIAVTDRVGNVLAVYSMAGAPTTMLTRPGPSGNLDAQGVTAAATAGAIAKAITGAYLSSGGNAFSTRTASQIVQQHFPPAPVTPGLE